MFIILSSFFFGIPICYFMFTFLFSLSLNVYQNEWNIVFDHSNLQFKLFFNIFKNNQTEKKILFFRIYDKQTVVVDIDDDDYHWLRRYNLTTEKHFKFLLNKHYHRPWWWWLWCFCWWRRFFFFFFCFPKTSTLLSSPSSLLFIIVARLAYDRITFSLDSMKNSFLFLLFPCFWFYLYVFYVWTTWMLFFYLFQASIIIIITKSSSFK